MREVISAFSVAPGVLDVGRLQREMTISVDAEDHALIQAKATAHEDGKADRETGSDTQRHNLRTLMLRRLDAEVKRRDDGRTEQPMTGPDRSGSLRTKAISLYWFARRWQRAIARSTMRSTGSLLGRCDD